MPTLHFNTREEAERAAAGLIGAWIAPDHLLGGWLVIYAG